MYIIDGFNLIHRVKVLKESKAPHCDLIHYIRKNKLTGSRNNKVIIVFDGKINFEVNKEREFEVIFSGSKSGDEVIKKRLEKIKNKSEVVVVSDDREVRDIVKREGARVCRTFDFIKTKKRPKIEEKQISYSLQREITEELRKIWLNE